MSLAMVFLKELHPYTFGLDTILDLIEYDNQKILTLLGGSRFDTAARHLEDVRIAENKRDLIVLACGEFSGAFDALAKVGTPDNSLKGQFLEVMYRAATLGLSKTTLLDKTLPALEKAMASAVMCATCYVYLDDAPMVEKWVTRSRETFEIYARQMRYIHGWANRASMRWEVPPSIERRVSEERQQLFETTNNLLEMRVPNSRKIGFPEDEDVESIDAVDKSS